MGMLPVSSDGMASIRGQGALKSRIETMRHDVRTRGECIVRYDELRALFADNTSPGNQWDEIAKIAIDEGWSFTFFPDRSVRFAAL